MYCKERLDLHQLFPSICEATSDTRLSCLQPDELWVVAETDFIMSLGVFNASSNLTQFPVWWSAFFPQINGTKLKHQFLADKIFSHFNSAWRESAAAPSSHILFFFFFLNQCWIHSYHPQNFFVNFSKGSVNLKWRHPYQIFRAWFKTWCVQGHSHGMFICMKHLGFECGCSTMKPRKLINSVCLCVYSALFQKLQAGCVTHMRVYQESRVEREILKHTDWIVLFLTPAKRK